MQLPYNIPEVNMKPLHHFTNILCSYKAITVILLSYKQYNAVATMQLPFSAACSFQLQVL